MHKFLVNNPPIFLSKTIYQLDNDKNKHNDIEKLMTNFDVILLAVYKEAINIYHQLNGDSSLYIKDKAYYNNGTIDSNMCSLWRQGNNSDLTSFWNILEELKSKNKS